MASEEKQPTLSLQSDSGNPEFAWIRTFIVSQTGGPISAPRLPIKPRWRSEKNYPRNIGLSSTIFSFHSDRISVRQSALSAPHAPFPNTAKKLELPKAGETIIGNLPGNGVFISSRTDIPIHPNLLVLRSIANTMTMPTQQRNKGFLNALAAFSAWGFVPIFFKMIQHVQPLEILCHRALWTVMFTALLISVNRDWAALRIDLFSKKVLLTLILTSLLLASNWLGFILAVTTDRVLEASLGYFIVPLINVLLGMLFLRERLRFLQGTAVVLAAAGTLNLTFNYGQIPWLSLFLAFSFGFYGLLRKTVRIGSLNGLFFEALLVSPPALLYLIVLSVQNRSSFLSINWETTFLLLSTGVVTTLPLMWFTKAARLLPLFAVGLFQYLAPSIHFLLAVYYYHEPFTSHHLITFGCIWTALLLFMVDALCHQRKPFP